MKKEYEDGMPPGAKVYMSEKSAYISATLFLRWLQSEFVSRKPKGPVVLILDGHASHCSSVEVLEYAEINDDSDISVILENDSSSSTDCENECVGCGEDYKKTVSREDWLQCVGCHRWLHDGCTSFTNRCLRCGRKYSL
nr:unnamed protein product [Callosobruchus analis]